MYKTKAYATASATSPLASTTIPRRDPTDRDVQIEILFCGICHSDLHYARDEWHDVMPTVYPCVPGHEIVGRVTKVGSGVSKFKADDLVGVGCLVDSDHTCPSCQAGLQQFCPNQVLTYGSPDRHKTAAVTYGGYSDSIVVDEGFVLRIPANLNLAGAAPLLCAGITTYSPMRHWGVTKGKKVGVVGLGGLVELEVDVETGQIQILNYVMGHDSGKLINPLIVDGQVQGAVAHGIGNATLEWMRYDEQGQPITTNFGEYLLPASEDVPRVSIVHLETPSPLNPLGVKGAGEGGTIPAAAAIISAIENALDDASIFLKDTPMTPQRLFDILKKPATAPQH